MLNPKSVVYNLFKPFHFTSDWACDFIFAVCFAIMVQHAWFLSSEKKVCSWT